MPLHRAAPCEDDHLDRLVRSRRVEVDVIVGADLVELGAHGGIEDLGVRVARRDVPAGPHREHELAIRDRRGARMAGVPIVVAVEDGRCQEWVDGVRTAKPGPADFQVHGDHIHFDHRALLVRGVSTDHLIGIGRAVDGDGAGPEVDRPGADVRVVGAAEAMRHRLHVRIVEGLLGAVAVVRERA
jgi:hypothetical protein